jgi:hypothetical protein
VQKDWLIYYQAKHNIKKCIKKLCVITTEDKRMFIKELYNGDKPGFYTLRGYKSEPIENVKIINAFPIIGIEPH